MGGRGDVAGCGWLSGRDLLVRLGFAGSLEWFADSLQHEEERAQVTAALS